MTPSHNMEYENINMKTKTGSIQIPKSFGCRGAPSKPDALTDDEWKSFVEKFDSFVFPFQMMNFGLLVICGYMVYFVAHWRMDKYNGQPYSREIGMAFAKSLVLISVILILLSAIGSRVIQHYLYKRVKKAAREMEALIPHCHLTVWTEPCKIFFLADQIHMTVEANESHNQVDAHF